MSLSIGAAIVLIVAGLGLFRETRAFRVLAGVPLNIAVLGAVLALCLVRGLYGLELRPVFALVWLAMMISLGCVVVKVFASSGFRRWGFLANHVGLWLVFLGGGLGTLDRVELSMHVSEGQTIEMPFEMRLDEFRMERYDDGMPSYYGSDVTFFSDNGSLERATIEVNHPYRRGSWAVYQSGYDETGTVFLVVRDPWLPVVYAGIFMLAVGAASLFFRRSAGGRGGRGGWRSENPILS